MLLQIVWPSICIEALSLKNNDKLRCMTWTCACILKNNHAYHWDPIINKSTRFLMEINKGSKRFKVNDKPDEKIKLYKHPIIPMATMMWASLGIHKRSWGYLTSSKVVKFELHIDCFIMRFFIINNLKSTTKPIDFISIMCNMS